MKFWAAVVDPGQRVKVDIEKGTILHLSQVSLGEIKKEKSNESIKLFKHSGDDDKLVLSTLMPDKLPQQQLDLMFRDGFEVSHNWKNGTVFFYGYMADSPFDDVESDEFDSDESDEGITITRPETGKPETKAKEEKRAEPKKTKAASESGAGKQVKIVEPSPVKTDDDDSSDNSGSGDEDDSTDEDEDDSDSEGQDGSDDSEEEETPKKKVESGKKRVAEVALKTPQEKKAKLITPQKTESKKSSGSVHVATPYPTKQTGKTGKTPATNKNPQTPKSTGTHSCKSCNKTFNSEAAIASHNKAKHSAGK